jgi:hypothetical protein
MRRLALLFGAAMAAFVSPLLAPDCAFACSCAVSSDSTPRERARGAFSDSEAVFAGEVVEIKGPRPARAGDLVSSGDPVYVTLKVSETWKGEAQETVEVRTVSSGASCGYPFERGEEYLVYASRGMEVQLCSETKPLSMAGADLAALGAGDRPERNGALPDTGGVVASNPRNTFLPAVFGGAVVVAASVVVARGLRRG